MTKPTSSSVHSAAASIRPEQSFWQSMAAEKPGSGKNLALGPALFVTVLQHNPKEVSKLMKKVMLLTLVVFAAAAMATAQLAGVPTAPSGTADVLGAHLGYGRGCIMCHAPHSGAGGNGVATKDPTSGDYALWGQDLTPLYSAALGFGDGGTYPVTLPAAGTITSAHDANTVVLFCLSCHDGNLAKVGMMKGKTVETLPIVGGNAPTLLGNDGTTAGNYANDHPVGPSAIVSCGGQYNWDCSGGNTVAISMNGPNSTIFAKTNYDIGAVKNLATFGTTVTAVTCTTCHNQHSMIIYHSSNGNNYQTAFFLRGYYNPATGGNNAAQFCRQCHGGEANEMNGQTAVPTT
jgi:hypothetical protein